MILMELMTFLIVGEQGDLGWSSNADTDHDSDGCQDDLIRRS